MRSRFAVTLAVLLLLGIVQTHSHFCSDVALFDRWNTVYRTYFKKEFPARAFIGSGRLLFGAHFEIQGIAVK